MYRPRKTSTDNKAPLGNQLRDALTRQKAGEEAQEQQRDQQAQDTLRQSLSTWFNGVAADVPKKVEAMTRTLNRGGAVTADFSYSAADDGVSLRGAGAIELNTLPGFQKLDETCRDLNIECTVTQGRSGYGRKSGAGKDYLHVEVDAAKTYRPLTAEKTTPRYRR